MFSYIILLATTAFSSQLSRRNVLRKILFIVPSLLIVGFKYEVGFDWNVYTEQFYTFSQIDFEQFRNNFFSYVILYQHEPMFVLLSYIGAKTLGTFEFLYCLLFIFFIYTTSRIGKVIGANIIAAFFVIHLFLLFTLEFSTLRQMVSLSILNLGIAMILEGNKVRGVAFLLLAPFFQFSSVIFVFFFLVTLATRRLLRIIIIFAFVCALVINVVGIEKLLSVFSSKIPSIFQTKLIYYMQNKLMDFSLLEALFAINLYLLLGYFLFLNRKNVNGNIALLSSFLILLIALAIAGFEFKTLRNRMLYEIIPISALMLFSTQSRQPVFLKPAIITMGVFFFTTSIIKPTSFMFVPYQNYIWFQILDLQSDGEARQAKLKLMLGNK